MKLPLALLFAAFAFGVTLPSAQATISINTQFAELFKSDGVTGVGIGGVGVLVVDKGGTLGISNPYNTTLSVGQFLGGGNDDVIIAVANTVANVAGTGFSGLQQNFTSIDSVSLGLVAGQKVYFLWFPDVSTVGSTVGAGVSYGVYRSDSVNSPSGSNFAFFVPGEGSTITLAVYTNTIVPTSGVTNADFTASQITAVPEPSSYALLGIAALGLTLWRRKRRLC